MKFIQLLKRQVTSPELAGDDVNDRFPTWKNQFGLFQDKRSLWRCGGRLQNADLSYSAKHPILLDGKHHHTVLVIRDAHIRVGHNGVRETLTEVRSKFWIIGGRSLVRSVIYRCVVCKRFEGRPVQAPQQPPLPEFRVKEASPFMFSAVDFAGPLWVQDKEMSRKIWICLFTCCVCRAIHLEVVLDMTTTAFLRCVKRFAARRGLPRRFLSDNAKTFKSAAKFLKAVSDHPDTKKYLSSTGIEWRFNLERAPWWGGLFERMVRSTKRCLRKIVGRARLSYDEMQTVIVEIEAIVNSRPLSYVHPDDLEEPLTPSHLIVGRRLLSLPDHLTYLEPVGDEDFELNVDTLQRRTKHLNNIINHFWRRWSREYLLELRDTHRQRSSSGIKNAIVVGDVVLIHDEDNPRGFWKLAKVQKLIIGQDGEIRGATLKVGSKDGTPTVLQRPLQLIYPLEINSGPPTAPVSGQEDDPVEQLHPSTSQEQADHPRPKREAALKARQLIKQWCAEDLVDHESVVNWGEDVVN